MGYQSSRLSYEKKDHKDIFFEGKLHDAMYLEDKLVWQKLYYNTFLCYTKVRNKACWRLVEIETKQVFEFIGKPTDCLIGEKKYLSNYAKSATERIYYAVNEMIFYKSTGGFSIRSGLPLYFYKPYMIANFADAGDNSIDVIRIMIGNDDSVSEELYAVTVPEIEAGYRMAFPMAHRRDKSDYFYSIKIASSYGKDPILYRLNGKTVEELVLRNYFSYKNVNQVVENPILFCAIGNYLYLGAVKYIENEASNDWLTIFSIVTINNMQIESDIAIESFKSDYQNIVSPNIQYFCKTYWISRFNKKAFLININGSNIVSSEITGEEFSVDLYDDGEKIGNVVVTTQNNTDFSTLNISLFQILGGSTLSSYDLYNTIDYTMNGFEETAWHNMLYDDSSNCFYIFYLKYLYDSDENFCIRVPKQEE